MKKMIPLILLPLFCFMPMAPQAQEWCMEVASCNDESQFYANLLVGANFLENTSIQQTKTNYKTGYIISASLGYNLCSDLSVEAEYAYRRNAISKIHFFGEGSSNRGHFQASSLMANLIWDVPLSSWGCGFYDINPFIGSGIGCDFQKMHSSNDRIIFNQKWKHFAWQLMAGLSYEAFYNTEMTFEYKFHQGGSRFNNHSLGVGLLYNFAIH